MKYYNRKENKYYKERHSSEDLEILTTREMKEKYDQKWVFVEYFNDNYKEGHVIAANNNNGMKLQETMKQEWDDNKNLGITQFFGGEDFVKM